jgi:hypothetical protein
MGHQHHRSPNLTESEQGQIAGWLVKLVVFIGIAGILILEIGGVLIAKGTVADAAASAAVDAAFAMKTTFNEAEAESAARQTAADKGSEFVSISIDRAGKTVTVTLQRKAKTRIVQHVSFLFKYAKAQASATRSFA